MTRSSSGSLVDAAASQSIGLLACNVITIEQAEGILLGAERSGASIMLQISENTVAFHGALEPLGSACLSLASHSSVPVAVHLDHATSEDLCRRAVELGFDSFMYDGSHLPYVENVSITKSLCEWAHTQGVWVEAELGKIGGKDGHHSATDRTDAGQAREFVAYTAVDGLAVAIGTSHAMSTQTAAIDFDHLDVLRRAVPVPLVMHGSSGVTNADLAQAVARGIVKVNVGTQVGASYVRALRNSFAEDPACFDPRKALSLARESVATTVARLIECLSPDAAPRGAASQRNRAVP